VLVELYFVVVVFLVVALVEGKNLYRQLYFVVVEWMKDDSLVEMAKL
jgi:hypothetical protein